MNRCTRWPALCWALARALWVWLWLWLRLGLSAAAAIVAMTSAGAAEQARIDAVIHAVDARVELKFVRNGRDYPAADAAHFLREKLHARGGAVRTAEAFVEQIATRSSTTGQPYLIRWPDGRSQPAADFLRAELRRLDAASASAPRARAAPGVQAR